MSEQLFRASFSTSVIPFANFPDRLEQRLLLFEQKVLELAEHDLVPWVKSRLPAKSGYLRSTVEVASTGNGYVLQVHAWYAEFVIQRNVGFAQRNRKQRKNLVVYRLVDSPEFKRRQREIVKKATLFARRAPL